MLREAEAGSTVVEVCRNHGISLQSFYLWKKKYAGLRRNELRELRQLCEENNKLKRLVADLSLDRHLLQKIVANKALKPRMRHELAQWAQHGELRAFVYKFLDLTQTIAERAFTNSNDR